jgi:DNA invertase Pin-like site-specific DNA recombinase
VRKKKTKKGKLMGRPPKKPEDRREAIITLRMTFAEREQLKKEAKKAGLTFSSYLIKCWKEVRG